MEKRSFPATVTGMMAAFLVWAAHFLTVYGVNGLICARGLDGAQILGLPLATALVLGATAVALLLTAGVLLAAWLGGGPAAVASADPRSFIRRFTILAAGAALVGILWNGLPALQVPACA